jgi:DNA-binding CsgD family transcriptional regulator/tetratricopeptide (TPR) repeat protein
VSTSVHDLVERCDEVAAIEEALSGAAAGAGSTLVVAGQAGVGKSALVLHAEELARDGGFTVLRSCPTPVSQILAHGVVRDWTGPLARRNAPGSKPFDGPAEGLADALTEPRPESHAWTLDMIDHALGWVVENLCDRGPLLLVVDDVQWADTGSLQVLDLLSTRLPRSSAVLLLGRRTGEPTLRPDILERISGRARVLTPQPLTVIGVDQMRQQQPDSGHGPLSAQEVHRVTGGLPFLVRELLHAAGGTGQPPRTVVEAVRERLARLGTPALELARTVALLGDDASFDSLGELCGMTVAELADPLEVLTDADITTLGLWRAWPSHPLVREAILATMSPSERSALHRRTADHLSRLDRPLQVVASHLVHTLPEEDPALVALLREAAQESLESGAPQVAAAQLLRAVGETTPDNTDPELLRLAAAAHMRAGLADQAFELWGRALDRLAPAEARARCLVDIGDAHTQLGARDAGRSAYRRAVDVLRAAGHDSTSPTLRLVLARLAMARAGHDDAGSTVEQATREVLSQPQDADDHADRLLLGLASNRMAMEGRDARRARELALRATAGGRLLEEETCEGTGFYMAVAACFWTDSFEEGLAELDQAVTRSRASGSLLGFATASYCRGFLHYRRGNLRRAVADLEAALEMRERGWQEYAGPALAVLAMARVALGQPDQAQALERELRALAVDNDLVTGFVHLALGLLRASRGDDNGALTEYESVSAIAGPRAGNPAFLEWRELAACSLLRLGRRTEARRLAQQAVDQARVWGSPRAVGSALTVLGHVTQAPESVRAWREAISLLEGCGAVDQLARARIALGSQLMRTSSTRREGAELLGEALDYARGSDVPGLVRRATRVLAQHGMEATGRFGTPLHLLTPGERRVVELAAQGHTNRTIAQRLFVTVKAVEWHLSNAYRKLEISSRGQLAAALAGQDGTDVGEASSSAR